MLGSLRLQAFEFADTCAGRVGRNETLIEACRLDTDFVGGALLPFMLVTGGLLPVVFWAVIALSIYVKYHNFVLSALVGIPVLSVAAFALPQYGEIYVSILLILGVAVTIFAVIWRVPRD